MDLGDSPKEIQILTPIELMFISKVKVFQTVIKLGAVGKMYHRVLGCLHYKETVFICLYHYNIQ